MPQSQTVAEGVIEGYVERVPEAVREGDTVTFVSFVRDYSEGSRTPAEYPHPPAQIAISDRKQRRVSREALTGAPPVRRGVPPGPHRGGGPGPGRRVGAARRG